MNAVQWGPLVWRSNALTSTVHLIEGGSPLCGTRNIILADDDAGGVHCSRCLRLARLTHRTFPLRGVVGETPE